MGVQTMSSLGGGGGGGALARQGSVYGLTLNEVESHLGEPLWSMNLEDLLRTVLPAADAEPRGAGNGKKTVDEVRRDIESAGRGRQPTVGEMTVEDFLSRAGVPVGGGGAAPARIGRSSSQYVTRPLGVGVGPVLLLDPAGSGPLVTQKNIPPPADHSRSYSNEKEGKDSALP